MLRPNLSRLVVGVAALLMPSWLNADVRLSELFTDHMVLQRGKPVRVWGWANHGEKVTVEFAGQKVSTVAVEGNWSVTLSRLKANSEPATLKVNGNNSLEVKDVLVGEVWVCSGQSNMEWPLSRSDKPEAAIAASANPQVRLFTVPKRRSPTPVIDINSQWVECTPDNTKNFSAVAFFFGRDLQKALGVPVGLIHTSWGGSPAEVWVSDDVLKNNPEYRRDIVDAYFPAFDRWAKTRQGFKPWQPSELYNGMIHPLLNYGIAGAIWYQGESNAGRAWQYRSLFGDMIKNWRRDFNQGDFPFLCVQLAPWDKNKKRSIEEITKAPGESDWAELREAQNYVGDKLPKVGVAIITDVGDKDDIHPTKKEPVGGRLALLARKIAYGERIVPTGPTYKKYMRAQKKIAIYFDHAGKKLEQDGETLTGFAIAGEDRKWHWAKAEIDPTRKNRVWVSCPDVPKPVAVRYGWSDYPVLNLKNSEGLPASPFRTDWWPATTLKNR